nr:uncharacterized protein LOC101153619 [Gorilla gorilla gorilla]
MFRCRSGLFHGCVASSSEVISFFGVFDTLWQQARRGESTRKQAEGIQRNSSRLQLKGRHQKRTPLGALAFKKVGEAHKHSIHPSQGTSLPGLWSREGHQAGRLEHTPSF